jgi:hypothetical protein
MEEKEDNKEKRQENEQVNYEVEAKVSSWCLESERVIATGNYHCSLKSVVYFKQVQGKMKRK